MIERIVEIIERPYLMDGMKVYSYGEQREQIIRGSECDLFDKCPIRKGDGTCFCWQARSKA